MRRMSREEVISSSYMELCMYNKTREIENKIAEGKVPETDRAKFHNIFRTEVKIKNGKLNIMKNKGQVPDKALETYYNDEMTSKIYNALIQKLFGINDFYRIDMAVEIVKNADNIRKDTRDKLISLLELINVEGYTRAKEHWVHKYSEATFRNHKKKIEDLGLNILTFDTRIDGFDIETERIKNFTSLENSVKK